MSDYTSNYMSNAARMIGFSQAYEKIFIDELRDRIQYLPKKERAGMQYIVDRFEQKHKIVDLWWTKRGNDNVTVEQIERELEDKAIVADIEQTLDIVQIERA